MSTSSDQGLEKDPNNGPLKSGLESVKKALDSSNPLGGGANPLGSMFQDPNLLGKLAANPRTSKFMADQSFVQKIRDLQNGGQADMSNIFQDQRMLAVMGVAMGIDMQAFERPEGSNEMPEGFEKLPENSFGTPAQPKSETKSATVEDEPENQPKASSSKPAASSSSSAPPKAKESEPEPMDVEPSEDDVSKSKAAELKAQGSSAYKSRDFDAAEKAFASAWEEYPKDITFLTNLAAVQFEQEKYDECRETCEKAVEQGRSLRADYKIIAKAIARIGSSYERQGNLELAVKAYGRALTEHRTPDVLAKLRNAEKVKAEQEKQAYIDPAKAEAAREEGNVHFKAGQFADAVKSYSEAIKRLPTDPRGYNNRAAAYTKLAALPEALKDAEEAVKIDPSFVKAYLRQSTVLLGMKEPTRAMEACQAATEADKEKKHTREIETQMIKCATETQAQRQGETDEQALERAMRDPEVAQIMVSCIVISLVALGIASTDKDPTHDRTTP